MSDWAPGDLALCIGHGADDVYEIEGTVPRAPGPVTGLTYTVAAVSAAFDCYGNPGIALALVEIPTKHPRAIGYNAEFFRKAKPHASDAEDIETIRLLNGQPVPVEA